MEDTVNKYPDKYKEIIFKARIADFDTILELTKQSADSLCKIRDVLDNKPFTLDHRYMDPDDHDKLDQTITAVLDMHRTLTNYLEGDKELLAGLDL